MSDALYDVGVALSLSTSGFEANALRALNVFKSLESAAMAADTAAGRFSPRINSAFADMQAAAGRTSAAYDAVGASMAQLASGGATLDQHVATTQALSAAQTDLASSQSTYNRLLGEQAAAATAAGTAQETLLGQQKAMQGMLLGGTGVLVGLAGVSAMKSWLDQAATMQDAMTQVGLAATGTHGQLQALQSQAYTVAGQTQFSAPQIANMEQMMARMGFRDLSGKQTQRQVIGQAIPEFARAAEIASHFQHVAPEQTVEALTMQAHQFGAYSGQALARNVAAAIGASLSSGMTLQQQSNILRYLQPAVKGLGMSATDAFSLAALANQTGLAAGRGGSNLGALFRYMMPSGSKAQQADLAQIEKLGGGDFFTKSGQFVGVGRALGIIDRFMTAPGLSAETRQADLVGAFRVQGAQAASLLGNPTAIKQFEAIGKSIAGYTPQKLIEMQEQLNQTLAGSLATLHTNLQSLGTMLGTDLAPAATTAARALVGVTGWMLKLGQADPLLVRAGAGFVAIGTAASGIGGALLLTSSAMKAFGLAGAGVSVGLGTAALTLGAFAGGIAAFALLFADWGNIMDATQGKMRHMGAATLALTSALEAMFAPIILAAQAKGWIDDLFGGGKGKPSTPPLHKGDVWDAKTGEWMQAATRGGVHGYVPDVRGLSQRQIKQLHIHPGAFVTHITVSGTADPHKIAAAVEKSNKKTLATLEDLAQGADFIANYGGIYPFTTNPTLRSEGR